jgi:hypothetical protein
LNNRRDPSAADCSTGFDANDRRVHSADLSTRLARGDQSIQICTSSIVVSIELGNHEVSFHLRLISMGLLGIPEESSVARGLSYDFLGVLQHLLLEPCRNERSLTMFDSDSFEGMNKTKHVVRQVI